MRTKIPRIKNYQREAVSVIENYLMSSTKGNCLIKLPTGTGKTGVMALAANLDKQNILIIVPNATLPEQIASEIQNDFWTNIKYYPPKIKKVIYINNSKSKELVEDPEGLIYVVTIQKLLSIFRRNKGFFENIKKIITTVFFDEGHKEPAEEWKSASRGLNKKTVLFTATPYRNDTNTFQIDENYKIEYTMEAAIENGDLKKVRFEKFSNDILQNDEDIAIFIKKLAERKENKILVRSKGHEKIFSLVRNLENEIKIIGCHSKLDKGKNVFTEGKQLLKEIKKRQDYQVIVHEDMLVEGINLPDLNVLVLLEKFDNYKSLIQQIGRILRPVGCMEAIVFVPDNIISNVIEQWNLYMDYEKEKDNVSYVNGLFRKKFSFSEAFKLCDIIEFSKQAKVFISDKSLLHSLISSLQESVDNLDNQRNLKEEKNAGDKFWVLCYEIEEPSPILKNAFWYQTSLEYVSLYEIKKDKQFYYFYHNTRRYALPKVFDDLKQIELANLYNLIPDGTEVIDVTYTNTSNSKRGAKTKATSGYSLESMPTSLSEKLSYCRNAVGKLKTGEKTVKRYISTKTGKVSDRDTCSYNEYIDWCNKLLETMFLNQGSNFFSRFAIEVTKPISAVTSLMITFDDALILEGNSFYQESQFSEVFNNEFIIQLGNKSVKGKVVEVNCKFIIRLDDGEKYSLLYNEKEISLVEYLEKDHFTLYFGEDQIIYNSNYFFKPNIPTRFDDITEYDMWSNIDSIKELGDVENEKLGKNPTKWFSRSSIWPMDSIFGVLVSKIKTMKEIDYLLCDDMGCEMADFVALSTSENRVIFIHCKHKNNDVSASAFEDVCGQANKNIHWLLTTNPNELVALATRQKDKWKNQWKSTQGDYLAERNVIGSVDKFVENYSLLMKKPNVKKEIWIVTSGLSKNEYEKELKKVKPSEQVAQLLYILSATRDNLAQAETSLHIFCKE